MTTKISEILWRGAAIVLGCVGIAIGLKWLAPPPPNLIAFVALTAAAYICAIKGGLEYIPPYSEWKKKDKQ